jgi:hypothetical protein
MRKKREVGECSAWRNHTQRTFNNNNELTTPKESSHKPVTSFLHWLEFNHAELQDTSELKLSESQLALKA